MPIDNPLDAYEKQYPKPEFDPLTLATSITPSLAERLFFFFVVATSELKPHT